MSESGDLRTDGFARYRGADPEWASARELGLKQLTEAFANLPHDPYAPGAGRFRRYSHAVYLPWTGELSWIPGRPDPEHGSLTEYFQDDYNPEYPQTLRYFPALPADLRGNALLNRMIRFDLERVGWLEELRRTPVCCGVHLVKLSVRDHRQAAVSSPNCLHQDGGSPAAFTFAHLIGCDNVLGGENVIASPDSAGRQPDDLPSTAVLARFTLTEPLDAYAVHDHRVSHYVSPVRLGEKPSAGERCVILIGIAPFVPRP
ncbi:2OG-Fe dioxygenase family protein [Actinomadura gamaensis]|uniref:2OG-Fe dioxygenase family protein n=1 Tax=Actinomadura gamaensis TaxID=1763541 RepID=A0ABV9U803_9ACTN